MLSIRFGEVATLVKHPLENIPLVILVLPFRINWLQTEFSVLKFQRWLWIFCLLYNNCFIDCFISDQNLPFADMKACFLSFTQKFFWNLSQCVVGNSKSFFAQNIRNVCWISEWDNINHVYQNSFKKIKVNWKNARRLHGVLGLTSWACLKAFKVYPAIYSRIPARAPSGARSYWKHCNLNEWL